MAASYDGDLLTYQLVMDAASATISWQNYSYDQNERVTRTIESGLVTKSAYYDGDHLTPISTAVHDLTLSRPVSRVILHTSEEHVR